MNIPSVDDFSAAKLAEVSDLVSNPNTFVANFMFQLQRKSKAAALAGSYCCEISCEIPCSSAHEKAIDAELEQRGFKSFWFNSTSRRTCEVSWSSMKRNIILAHVGNVTGGGFFISHAMPLEDAQRLESTTPGTFLIPSDVLDLFTAYEARLRSLSGSRK